MTKRKCSFSSIKKFILNKSNKSKITFAKNLRLGNRRVIEDKITENTLDECFENKTEEICSILELEICSKLKVINSRKNSRKCLKIKSLKSVIEEARKEIITKDMNYSSVSLNTEQEEYVDTDHLIMSLALRNNNSDYIEMF